MPYALRFGAVNVPLPVRFFSPPVSVNTRLAFPVTVSGDNTPFKSRSSCMLLPFSSMFMSSEGIKRAVPDALTSAPSTSARTLFRFMLSIFPAMSAVMLSRANPIAFRAGMLAVRVIAGFVLLPETLSEPVNFPLRSIPDMAASGERSKSVNLKLKSSGDFPETDAVPAPVIVPAPLLALRPPNMMLSPFLLIIALTPENVAPEAVIDSAAVFTVMRSRLARSPFSAVVSSMFFAAIIFMASSFGDDARRFTSGLLILPCTLSPAFTVPLRAYCSMSGT